MSQWVPSSWFSFEWESVKAVFNIYNVLGHLVNKTTYQSISNWAECSKVLDVLDACQLKVGKHLLRRRTCPSWCFGWHPSPFWMTSNVSVRGFEGLDSTEINIYRLIWQGPLIPDPDSTEAGDDDINVLQNSSNEILHPQCINFSEQMMDDAVPPAARIAAEQAAKHIVSVYMSGSTSKQILTTTAKSFGGSKTQPVVPKRGSKKARVFILCGKPGTGKSTTARVVTHLLKGTLYDAYDPTRVGENWKSLVADHADSESPLIIAFEEFDVALAAVVGETVADSATQRLDAKNKTTWNGMLDSMKKKRNVIMIMTTNKTEQELMEMCKDAAGRLDASLLKIGRIDMFMPFGVNLSPMTATVSVESSTSSDRSDRSDGSDRSDRSDGSDGSDRSDRSDTCVDHHE